MEERSKSEERKRNSIKNGKREEKEMDKLRKEDVYCRVS